MRALCALILCLAIAACSPAPIRSDFADPLEAPNRKVHAFNRGLDQIIVRPTANAYGTVVPSPIRTGVGNFASNLNLPGMVLNNVVQLRFDDAMTNTFRFLVNSTFGLGGVLDVATEAGIPEETTDFGETLHIWGVTEGRYLEVPAIGPSTSRHLVGRIVDTALNPLNFAIENPERGIVTATGIAARFGDRYRFSDFIDSVLYESEDSYAQSRLLYLQNRRFFLSEDDTPEFSDPYEDIYGPE